jgi:preprotein translocase subunit SecY
VDENQPARALRAVPARAAAASGASGAEAAPMNILRSIRNLFKIPELRRRILWTFGLLVVFRAGSHLPLPGVNPEAIRAFADQASQSMGGLWGILQMFSGGAIGHLALFSLGIAPYITASIILQLLTKVNPALEAMSREGPGGQRRLRQITQYATIPVCLVQASLAVWQLAGAGARQSRGGALPLLVSDSFGTLALLVAGLTAGALFVYWLGEQITERGLGNGASVLIMAGIVVRMPALLGGMIRRSQEGALAADAVLLVVALYLAAVVATVFISQAQRRIPLQHASHVRGRRIELGGRNYLPLRLLSAGVMPIVFASSFLVLPALVGLLPGLHWIREPFERAGFAFTLFYLAAILFLSYFWTYVFFSPTEIALQLRERGSFIPGLRPGDITAAYLNGILSRITLCGAVFLAAIALLPGFLAQALGLGQLLEAFLGGSGLLIVVGVGLDLIQKMESWLTMHRYGGFLGEGGALRGRR